MDTLLRLGDSLFRRSPDSARVLWDAALESAKAVGDSAGIARALTGLGQSARELGDYPASRELGEQALALKLRLGLTSELARSYNALGLLAWYEERLVDAAALFAKVGEVARASGDTASMAKAAINTGLVLDNLGNFAAARRALEAGRDIARIAGDSVSLGRALTNLARLDIALGDPIAALARLAAARRLFRATGDSIGEVNAIGQVATAHDARGESQAAFAALDTAQRMANRLGFRREAAENLTLIGDLFNDAGDHRHALDYYARALTATDSLGLPEERGNILRSEARAHAGLGNHRLAMRRGRDALQVHRTGGFRYAQVADRLLLAELSQELTNAAEADEHLRSARALSATLDDDVVSARVALTEARVAAASNQSTRVLRALDAASESIRLLGNGGIADAMALRARAYAEMGQLETAAAAGAQAIAAVERIRGSYQSGELRTSYASAKSAMYVEQALLLLRLKRDTDAFRVADAARGRALLEHLATARADIRADDPTRSVLEKEQLLRRIDALAAKLRERAAPLPPERTPALLAVTKELTDSLVAARSEYEALLARSIVGGRPPTVSLLEAGATASDVRASLDANEALVEYFVTPSRLLIFVVTRSGLTTYQSQEGAASLASRVRLARELVQQSAGDAAGGVLRALHRIVLGPVDASGALNGISRLVVVPHSVLTYLPFAALIDARTNEFLVQRYAVLHAPTAGAFVAMRSARGAESAARGARPALSAVFSPFPDDLPATRDEASTFLRSIRPSVSHVGAEATEGRLRTALESGVIVHVATHAVMNARNPLFSRIELAGDHGGPSSDDGRLEIHELLGLRSSSTLVFLSGCETALGAAGSTPFDVGEDFTTIGQALLHAGARDVVATLWRIDDRAAGEFARLFYDSLMVTSATEALARAQRAMIANPQLRQPYLWAAYQVSGVGVGTILPSKPQVVSVER